MVKDRILLTNLRFNLFQQPMEQGTADFVLHNIECSRDIALLLVKLIVESVISLPLSNALFVSIDLFTKSKMLFLGDIFF